MPCNKLPSGKWRYGEHGQEYETEGKCREVEIAIHASKDCFMQETMDASPYTMTDEGFLVTKGAMARSGVQSYRAIEISKDLYPNDPLRIVKVYRPHSEVFDSASMKSFENKPVTIGHPVGTLVNSENWKELAKGEVRDVTRDGDLMIGTLIIKDSQAISSVKAGLVQLSNGYTNDLEFTPGTTPSGESYDAIQRNIRGNHVALVTRARCGEQCSISTDGDDTMVMKVTVDGIPLEVNETAAAAISKLQASVQDGTTQVKTLNDSLTLAQKSVDEYKAKIVELEAQLVKANDPKTLAVAAQDWATMVMDGEKIVSDFKPEVSSCVEYKRAIIAKAVGSNDAHKPLVDAVLGGKALGDASAEGVQAAFRVLASLSTPTSKAVVGDGGAGKVFLATANDASPEATGISSFHQRMRGGFAAKQ